MDQKTASQRLERAKKGDPDAIAALYQAHYQSVYNYLFYRVDNQQTAEDLTTEVFLRMITRLPGYRDQGRPLLAWLYTIARNLVIDEYRAREKRDTAALDEVSLASDEPGPAQQAQMGQTGDCFRRALELLPESQRILLIYRFVDRRSTSEIIQLLDKSDRAVRSLQHRALRSLERALREENCL